MDFDAWRPTPHGIAVVIAMGVVVLALGTTRTDLAVGPEGLYHAAIVAQISHGLVPPADPAQWGAPVPSMWGWHATIATLCDLTGMRVFEVCTALSAVAAATVTATGWAQTVLVTRRPFVRAAFTLLPWALAFPWFGRGADGMIAGTLGTRPDAAALAVVAVALVVAARVRWATRARVAAGLLLSIAAAGLGLAPTLALAIGAVALAGTAGVEHVPAGRPWAAAHQAAPPIAALLLASPAAWWIADFHAEIPSRRAFGVDLLRLVPSALIYAVAFRHFWRLPRPVRQLAVVGALSAGLWAGWTRPDGGMDLFLWVACCAAAPVALALLDETLPDWRGAAGAGGRRRDLLAGAVLLGSLSAIWLESHALMQSPWGPRYVDVGRGVAVLDPEARDRRAVERWIRDRLPNTALLATSRGYARELAALAERPVVAAPGGWRGGGDEAEVLQAQTDEVVTALAQCRLGPSELARWWARPVPWPTSVYVVAPTPEESPCYRLPRGVADVFRTPGWTVYVVAADSGL